MNPEPRIHHDHLLRVIYRDTDQMGVVYYGNYYSYMEIGRVELMRAKGSSYRSLEESGIWIPVVHSQCDYNKPAKYDDLLRIRTTIAEITRIRLNFHYEIFHTEAGDLLASGQTHHVFMNREFKPVRVAKELVERLSAPIVD